MSSNKIVEDWVAKYGNNPEVDKIVNERVEYMNKKPHQRLLDGMPPHIAEKVDKMILEMKQLHDAATDYGWKIKTNTFSDPVKANELAESAKQDFIAGAKWMMEKQKQKQALVDIMEEDAKNGMYDQPDKIKVTVKNDSPAANIIKAAKAEKQAFKEAVKSGKINLQEIPKEQLEQERNPNYKYFDAPELRYKDGTPMRKYNSPKLKAIEMENKQQTAVDWLINKLHQLAHNKSTHIGMGDVRVTQGMIDEFEEQAKQMEKEQMNDCWRFGRGSHIDKEPETFEQYYNETYGK